jgi:peptidoglycan/xylan/chitin deacetylase (PgdA/CDA1 family)
VFRLAAAVLAIGIVSASSGQPPSGGRPSRPREMAVTIDDLPTASVLPQSPEWADRVTRDLLSALRRHEAPAIGFVNEGKLHVDGRLDERRVALLQRWIDGGLELGNHGYAHLDLHRVPPQQFTADIERGEPVTRGLLEKAGRRPRFFRHPFLHTGRSADARAAVEAYLGSKRLRVAPVSVDNYDYVFAAAYDRAVDGRQDPWVSRIISTYVNYMLAMVAYYEEQSQKIVGREIRHVLLLHANALNARAFDELARRLEARGYSFVTLERALEDPAYASEDKYFGPAGVTWLHRWAMTRKMPSATFAGEPTVPAWVTKISGIGQ